MPRKIAVLSFLLLLGCGHTEPFATPSDGTDQPFDPSPPVRITLNAGADRTAGWLADGSGILYTAQQVGRADRDQCLALLPPTGGRQRELWCDYPTGVGWTDAILSPAVSVEGRLAFLGGSSRGVNPEILGLRVASGLDPIAGTLLRTLPYPGATATITALSQIRWQRADRLIFIAQRVRYRDLCTACPVDTVLTNVGLELLDAVAVPNATPIPVPGTELATGVAPIEGTEDILFTVVGDSRIYRRNLTTQAVEVAHDFGAAGVARDLHLVGNRLAVVVGGVTAIENDIELGAPVQWDSGGVIHVLDLGSGADTPLDATGRLYRRPALAPAGDRLVAEGYAMDISEIRNPDTGDLIAVDTAVSGHSDLFLFGAQ